MASPDNLNVDDTSTLSPRAISYLYKSGIWMLLFGAVILFICAVALLLLYVVYIKFIAPYTYLRDSRDTSGLVRTMWENYYFNRVRLFRVTTLFLVADIILLTLAAIQAFKYYLYCNKLSASKSPEDSEHCTQSVLGVLRYTGIASIVGILGAIIFALLFPY